jgi:hypothetical protein
MYPFIPKKKQDAQCRSCARLFVRRKSMPLSIAHLKADIAKLLYPGKTGTEEQDKHYSTSSTVA